MTTATRSIAPSYPQSATDKAAHAAASYVRTAPATDSDPENEALRRVRATGTALRAGMAEYREWVAGVAA